MAISTVLTFMQQTAANQTLRQQLEALLGVGDGDISSEAALDAEESAALSQRAPRVAEFAASHGYDFSADELLTVVNAFEQHQQGQLSDDEFAKLIGLASGTVLKAKTQGSFQQIANYLSKTYLGIKLK